VSLNRWVFKWRLNVETLSHSLMSAGKEFQMDRAATYTKDALLSDEIPLSIYHRYKL